MSFMTSFERGMEKVLVPIAIRLNSQRHIAAIRDAFILSFPLVMASSFIILINFAILSPDGFIAKKCSRTPKMNFCLIDGMDRQNTQITLPERNAIDG